MHTHTIHPCVCSHTHTCKHTYAQTYTHTYTCTNMLRHKYTHTYACSHTHIHVHSHTCIDIYTHTHTCTDIYTLIHIHSQTCIHTCTHTLTHTDQHSQHTLSHAYLVIMELDTLPAISSQDRSVFLCLDIKPRQTVWHPSFTPENQGLTSALVASFWLVALSWLVPSSFQPLGLTLWSLPPATKPLIAFAPLHLLISILDLLCKFAWHFFIHILPVTCFSRFFIRG